MRALSRLPVKLPRLLPSLVLFAALACTDSVPTAPPTLQASVSAAHVLDRPLTVMTYNASVGTNVFLVIAAPPAQVPSAVSTVFGFTVASNPPARMAELAEQIATAHPDVVGLQEIDAFYTQRPGDFLIGNPVQASHVEFDFLQLVVDALHALHADYHVAAVSPHTDIELPALDAGMAPVPQNFYDVRLADRDAILVRDGVDFSNAQAANYQARIPLNVGGVTFNFLRGWASVDVSVKGGRPVRFITTHMETQQAIPVQLAQADELIQIVNASPLPVILAGDFNSAANPSAPAVSTTPTYDKLLQAGLADAWLLTPQHTEGLTCCHDELDFSSTAHAFDQRLDLVLLHGIPGAAHVSVVGDRLNERTPSGLWASDHAGLLAHISAGAGVMARRN